MGTRELNESTRVATSGESSSRPESDPHESNGYAKESWHAIKFRHLAALVAVGDEASFRRAADRLGYVQSAVSGQIAYLERIVDVRLVERSSGAGRVALTREGEALVRHAHEILDLFQGAQTSVSAATRRPPSAVRVAGLEQLPPRHVARTLSQFREQHPFARIVLSRVLSDGQDGRGVSPQADVVITELSGVDGQGDHETLFRDPYSLLVARDSSLAALSAPPDASRLAQIRPMVPGPYPISRALDCQLRDLEIPQHRYLRPESVATAAALVAYGLGAAIVPASATDRSEPTCVALDLSRVFAPRTFVAVLNAHELTPAANGFVATLRETCASNGSDAIGA